MELPGSRFISELETHLREHRLYIDFYSQILSELKPQQVPRVSHPGQTPAVRTKKALKWVNSFFTASTFSVQILPVCNAIINPLTGTISSGALYDCAYKAYSCGAIFKVKFCYLQFLGYTRNALCKE